MEPEIKGNYYISKLDSTILALENERFETEISSDVAAELGPLKYISKISGWEMDKTVNILILIIVFVFDPLAICLVLAANFAFGQAFPKKRENIYGEKVVITQTPIVELEADPDDLPDLGEKKTNLEREKKTLAKEKIKGEITELTNRLKYNPPISKTENEVIKNKITKLNKKLKDDDLTITY
jgi:hypothetical protein